MHTTTVFLFTSESYVKCGYKGICYKNKLRKKSCLDITLGAKIKNEAKHATINEIIENQCDVTE